MRRLAALSMAWPFPNRELFSVSFLLRLINALLFTHQITESVIAEDNSDKKSEEAHSKTTNKKANSGGSLCDVCRLLDFRITRKDENDPRTPTAAKHELGYVDEISLRKNCSFCSLITEALRISYTELPLRTLTTGERIRCYIPASNCPGNFDEKEHETPRRNWELFICLHYYPPPFLQASCKCLFSPTIRLDHQNAALVTTDRGVVSLGRMLNPRSCDHQFLIDCYRNCRNQHGVGCEKPNHHLNTGIVDHLLQTTGLNKRHLKAPRDFRLIDVIEYRLVPAPEACEWITLSYVWGQTPFLKLTRANYAELTCVGSLRKYVMPRTIREAIDLVSTLGERYLWIDALCIIQDDEKDISKQITQMDSIYGFSGLTIIAGSGESVESGLAGYAPNSRSSQQISARLHDLQFFAMGPNLEAIIPTLTWNTRAWTYQEFWLSKRLMVFTPQQVFFVCAAEPVNEDSVHYDGNFEKWCFQDPETMDLSYTLDKEFTDFPWRMCREIKPNNRGHLINRVSKDLCFSKAYKSLVRDYTRREITKEGDALYAISAVFQSLAPFKSDNFICGLPESTLDWAILWQPTDKFLRRTSGTQIFPSWSWAGWSGPRSYASPDDGTKYVQPTVNNWKLVVRNPGDCQQFEESEFMDLIVDASSWNWQTSSSERESIEIHRKTVLRQREERPSVIDGLIKYAYLIFTTRSAEFTVEATQDAAVRSPAQFLDNLNEDREIGLYRVKYGNLWVGIICLEAAFARTLGDGYIGAEFIILSNNTIAWSATNLEGGKWVPARIHDDRFWNKPVGVIDERPMLHNVMWIRREGEVAYRVGVGQIHVDGWAEAVSEEKEIYLG